MKNQSKKKSFIRKTDLRLGSPLNHKSEPSETTRTNPRKSRRHPPDPEGLDDMLFDISEESPPSPGTE